MRKEKGALSVKMFLIVECISGIEYGAAGKDSSQSEVNTHVNKEYLDALCVEQKTPCAS